MDRQLLTNLKIKGSDKYNLSNLFFLHLYFYLMIISKNCYRLWTPLRSVVFPTNDSCQKISAENYTSINKERPIIVVYFFCGEGGGGVGRWFFRVEVACKTAPLQLALFLAQKDLPLGSPMCFIRNAKNRNKTGNWTASYVLKCNNSSKFLSDTV